MNIARRIKGILTLVTVITMAATGFAMAIEGQLGILTSETLSGNNPATGAPWAIGDQYRFVFFTSASTAATSADIATYNEWVQGLADASTVYNIGSDDGVTWKAIGSTPTVDARDNTSTNPTVESGHAIFLLDGSTVVANDYADLWDGEIQNIIDLTEKGTISTYWPFTGTYTDGTSVTGKPSSFSPLGGGNDVNQGNSGNAAQWIWRAWTSAPAADPLQMYAMSDPLFIIGEIDPTLPSVDAGRDVVSWSGQDVILDPDVVNNSNPPTALTYAWSANPDVGVTWSATNVEAPTINITKAAGNPVTVTLRLAVNNVGSGKDDIIDTMTIEVYDNSCLAAKSLGPVTLDPTDFDGDCITGFEDFVIIMASWFIDYTATGPVAE